MTGNADAVSLFGTFAADASQLSDYLQDWPTWLDNRFIDAVTVDATDAPPPVSPQR